MLRTPDNSSSSLDAVRPVRKALSVLALTILAAIVWSLGSVIVLTNFAERQHESLDAEVRDLLIAQNLARLAERRGLRTREYVLLQDTNSRVSLQGDRLEFQQELDELRARVKDPQDEQVLTNIAAIQEHIRQEVDAIAPLGFDEELTLEEVRLFLTEIDPLYVELETALGAYVERRYARLNELSKRLADGRENMRRWVVASLIGLALFGFFIGVLIYRLLRSLNTSELRYLRTFNRAPMGMAYVDSEGRWIRINPRYAQILDRSPEELVGRKAIDFTHPEDKDAERLALADLLAGRTDMITLEKRHMRDDGTSLPIRVTASLARERGAAGNYLIVISEDISERKAAEEARRRAEEYFQNALEMAPLPIVVYASNLEILHVNRAWTQVTGYSMEEIPTVQDWARLAYGDKADEVVATAQELVATERHLEQAEYTVRTKSGELRTLLVNSSFLGHLSDGRGLRMTAAIDLTDRIRAEDERRKLLNELQEALRIRDDFLSIAAHELRTPLTPLRLQLGSLQRKLPDAGGDPKIADKIQQALNQTERLASLVDKLLDVSRISGGKLVLEPEEVSLEAVVRDVLGQFAIKAERLGCEIRLQIDDPGLGDWDPLRIEQAVSNLISNALKYGAGHPVEVRVNGTENEATLVVRDYGIGIASPHRERVFERFERAVSSRHYGGFGIGLWLTREIVLAHGGRIDLESEPGQGSAFTIRLPRHPRPQEKMTHGGHAFTDH